ncbi:MAG: lactonase family protein [Acidaminococcaceae bacterium]|jgi:6-phosphogluconolactonase (cycloisomerase 2 family)|nr:lactonase family protein [Acidaminococcaceae bacterium]MCI2110220.1 lactonase family protein [Acidaminococcaceae bacterium]
MYAYVGCRTTKERNANGKGIRVYKIVNGQWQFTQLLSDLINPSFLCFDETEKFLYTVHGDFSEISSFSIDAATGHLTLLNTVETGGKNPVHLSVDKSNKWIYVANLETGTVAVVPRNSDGTLKKLKTLYAISGIKEGSISHPHQVLQDPSRNYLLVSCQGRKAGFGQVDVFRINHSTGEMTKTCTTRSREIAEPRHMVFSGIQNYCYGVNEKDYSITTYYFDAKIGTLEPKQIVPTLPETYTGDGWASGIVAGRDGRHIYVSNRKHNSVSVFKVNPENGFVKLQSCILTGGNQPRFITITPDGTELVAANELSDTIRIFTIDKTTGNLTFSGKEIKTENPVCVVFSK